MLAENLVDVQRPLEQNNAPDHQLQILGKEANENVVSERTESDAAGKNKLWSVIGNQFPKLFFHVEVISIINKAPGNARCKS